jgi:hypothetical protein
MPFYFKVFLVLVLVGVAAVIIAHKFQHHSEKREAEPGDASQKIDAVMDQEGFSSMMRSGPLSHDAGKRPPPGTGSKPKDAKS